MKRFVFLDRDGTLIVERNYLADPAGVELVSGAAEALRRLREAGFGIAVITNQSGIARRYLDADRLNAIHDRIRELLAAGGASLDAFYVCPHHPDDGCACRKPQTALIDRAAGEHEIDRNGSFIIGDKESDIDCGKNARLTTILVRTGYGASLESTVGQRADFVARDLVEAVEWILRSDGR